MRPRRPEYDSKEFRAEWFGGLTIEAMAAKYGVDKRAIHVAAKRRGFPGKIEIREMARANQ